MNKTIIIWISGILFFSTFVNAGAAIGGAAAAAAIAANNNNQQIEEAAVVQSGIVPLNYSLTNGCSLYKDPRTPVNVFRCEYGNGTTEYLTSDEHGQVIGIDKKVSMGNYLQVLLMIGIILIVIGMFAIMFRVG